MSYDAAVNEVHNSFGADLYNKTECFLNMHEPYWWG